jgi:hypothetical protein
MEVRLSPDSQPPKAASIFGELIEADGIANVVVFVQGKVFFIACRCDGNVATGTDRIEKAACIPPMRKTDR